MGILAAVLLYRAGEFYSQGDGKFRYICPNRRSDVISCPECVDFDVWMFMCRMQLDGYNPLFVKDTTFSVKPGMEQKAKDIINSGVEGCADTATVLIDGKFTAGSLINGIYNAGGSLNKMTTIFL